MAFENGFEDETCITGILIRKVQTTTRPKHLNVKIPVRQISSSNPPKTDTYQ